MSACLTRQGAGAPHPSFTRLLSSFLFILGYARLSGTLVTAKTADERGYAVNGGPTVRSGRAGRWSAAAALLALAVPLALTGGAGPADAAPQAGDISTVAGGTGGPGLATQVGLPGDCGVSYGGGHVLIADGESVRSLTPATDQLTTPAGTGGAGEYGDDGPATSADMYACAAGSGSDGSLLIADSMYNRIRMVAGTSGTFFGQ